MNKRRLERVAVMILSIAMMLSSTGILSSLAANVGESDSAQTSTVSETGSTTVNQETTTATTEAQVSDENGNGTVENPYKISNTDEFLNMQKTANLTNSSNKNFVLTADIDLSDVTEETFKKNGGSLVAVNDSANAFFNLDGNGHRIKGLNVKADTSEKISIFGVVNAKSSIKNLVIEKPQISSKSENLVSVAVVASENKGTISNVKVMYPFITVAKCTYAALVADVNDGIISNVTVQGTQTNAGASTADSHTIMANGVVGAVAAVNKGRISAVSAINIGMFIPESKSLNTVYGGIAGYCEGTVSDSVSTGNVCGGKSTDIVGGIAGKAVKTPKLTNNYILVSISKSVQGAAVIGSAGKAEMIKDCFWSATVSKKSVPVTDFGSNENNVITNTFKVVSVGKTAGVSASDVSKMSWGKALFSLDGKFTSKDSNIKANSDSTAMTINGEKADSISKITYVANIILPATVGAGTGSVTVKQYMNVYVLTVPENVKGNGTEGSPLEISNSAEFSFLKYAVNINCKLTKDIVTDVNADYFCGTIDGNGHKISTNGTLFNSVCGTVKNLSVVVTENISRGIFANIYGAKMNNVSVELKDGVKFNAEKSNTGIFANRIGDASVLDDCRVKGEISVTAEKLTNIGGFAGLIGGKNVSITNSGACVGISGKKADAANFIGSVSAENATIESCYAAGVNNSGEYMFISAINAKTVTIKNIYIDYSDVKSTVSKAIDFETYKALVNENQFTEWAFEDGVAGFFTGNGGKFTANIPAIKSMQNSSAADYKLSFDSSKVMASVTVDGGKLTLNVNRVNGVVTVKAVPVTVTNEKTGLSAKIYVSNGLEKDSSGNWIISNGFDLAYVSENIAELADDSFVVNSDIDMTAIKGFAPIGSTAVAFSGKFDGNGHTISNLAINGTAKTALFGVLSDAEVKNIKILNSTINSESGYAAVLAGQATGKTVITNVKVNNGKVNVNGNYASIIVASVDNAVAVKISDITVDNSEIKSSAGYVGAVAGHITEDTAISDVNVYKFKATGSNHVSGIVGFAQSEKSTTIRDVKIISSDISGVSEISGIAAGIGKGVSITDSAVVSSKIATLNGTSPFTAGGVAAVFGALIDNVTVEKTEIKAGIAGGAVAKTAENCELTLNNVTINGCKISADAENTVAAGLLGVHNTAGTASIKNSTVSADTVIGDAAVTAGVVGDCFGADSALTVDNVKTFAMVEGGTNAGAVAAGVLGRIGSSAINGVQIKNTVVGGTVSGDDVLGGIIGLIKNGEAYNGKASLVSATTAYPQIKTASAQAGMIIGGTEGKKVLASDNLDNAISDVIISTYFGEISAFSPESKLEGGKYFDMDKPNGKNITTSVEKLTTAEETEIKINNLPKIDGFSFDAKSGWISESDERIQVVSFTENTAVLKANHMADISVIGYYTLDSDSDVKVPVHFRMISDIRTPLKGDGTKENPYLVSCAYDLETVAQYDSENAYFALTKDIKFVPADFEFGGAFYNVGNGVVTIGDVTNAFKGTFTGLYNGKVHSITGLSVAGNAFGGLFGATDGAVISDLVINNATVSGLNYAGVVAGSAKNTTIKNIVINSANVEVAELGGYAGAVVGNAENTVIENIQINGAEIKATCQANGVSVEAVGGVAGVFSGSIENVEIENLAINSTSVAGGAVGIVKDGASVKSVDIDAGIKAQLVGGVAGRVDNPLKFTINECNIGGSLDGEKITAGVIGKVTADSSADNVSKAETPIISDTLVTAKLAKSDVCAIAVGEASAKVFTETENKNTDVFKNVYYSSYQNNAGAFGVEEINAYQSSEYVLTDLSDIRYADGAVEKDYIPLGTEPLELKTESIKLNGANGNYKLFTVNGKAFMLQSIKAENSDIIDYDAETSIIRLNSAITSDEKAVFEYNDGLALAMSVGQNTDLSGIGTETNPYVISTADDFAAMLMNASAEDVYYVLGADIKLTGIGSAELFAGVLDGNGHVLYDYTGTSLFGRVTGEIKNTGFVGFDVTDNKSVAVGAVAGAVDGGKITDCFVIANVSAGAGKQDVGVLAGRAVNGAQISGVLTSGKVLAEKAIAVGGAVGLVSDSELKNITSTAYVKGGSSVGGIAGEMLRSTLATAVFGNMVESVGSDFGNVVGSTDKASKISSVYFDNSASRSDKAVGSGEKVESKALTTAQLKSAAINDFKTVGGYPVPAKLAEFDNAKFATGVGFASITINYLAGLSAGTVYNYTDITVDTSVNGNDVVLEKNSGLTLTLATNADYADAKNAIMRYTNPLTTTAVDINCSFVDATSGKLGSGLVGILLKSKAGSASSAFDFFMKANDDEKDIGSVVVTDGKLYVNAELPSNVKFSVTAVDENGKALSVADAKNEGMLISTGNSKSVSLVITAENNSEEIWGLRSLQSVIGK